VRRICGVRAGERMEGVGAKVAMRRRRGRKEEVRFPLPLPLLLTGSFSRCRAMNGMVLHRKARESAGDWNNPPVESGRERHRARGEIIAAPLRSLLIQR